MKTKKRIAVEHAISELEDAKAILYEAANELLIERSTDPVAPQLDALAEQTQRAIDTLKDRLKHASLLS